MKKLTTILFLFFSLSGVAKSDSDMDTIKHYMVVAKATGMCGVFVQMASFQEATKMKGGTEFIVRFLSTEAARLGYTLDAFMESCPKVTKKYKTFMEILNESEVKK